MSLAGGYIPAHKGTHISTYANIHEGIFGSHSKQVFPPAKMEEKTNIDRNFKTYSQ